MRRSAFVLPLLLAALSTPAVYGQAENPCADADVAVIFQERPLVYSPDLFAGMPPLREGYPPTKLVLSPGERDLYVALVSNLSEVGIQGWLVTFDALGDVDVFAARWEGVAEVLEFAGITPLGDEIGAGQFEQGFTAAAILSFDVLVTLQPVGTFTTLAFTVRGEAGASADFVWLSDQNRPPDATQASSPKGGTGGTAPYNPSIATIQGRSHRMCELSMQVIFDNAAASDFVRCEANGDGSLDIADGIFILNDLFTDVDAPCPAATDCNDDGSRDISDAIYAFTFLFVDGSPPPAPYPECGGSTKIEAVDCPVLSTSCP